MARTDFERPNNDPGDHCQRESAKFWLRVMNALRNRGTEDVLLAVVDGLKGGVAQGSDDTQHRWNGCGGFPEAITAVFPETIVQTCIVGSLRKPDFERDAVRAIPDRLAFPLRGVFS